MTTNADHTFGLHADMVLETTIARRDGGATIQMRLGDFPANAIERMLRYGAQRIFNDPFGGKDTTAEEKLAGAKEMIARFKLGQVGRTTHAGADPLTNECRKIVRAYIRTNDTDAYKRLKAMDDDARDVKLDDITAKNAWVGEKAKKDIATRAAEAKKNAGLALEGMDL